MGILEALASLFKLINGIFDKMHDDGLKKQGHLEAKNSIEEHEDKVEEIVDEIDNSPDADNLDDLWNGL